MRTEDSTNLLNCPAMCLRALRLAIDRCRFRKTTTGFIDQAYTEKKKSPEIIIIPGDFVFVSGLPPGSFMYTGSFLVFVIQGDLSALDLDTDLIQNLADRSVIRTV